MALAAEDATLEVGTRADGSLLVATEGGPGYPATLSRADYLALFGPLRGGSFLIVAHGENVHVSLYQVRFIEDLTVSGASPANQRGSLPDYRLQAHSRYHAAMEFQTSHPYVLTASCTSRMGTAAAVTGFIAAHRLYIMEMQQFDDILTKRFFLRVTFCAVAGETVDLVRLREEFVRVANAEQMHWNIHDGQHRSRVLILVSKLDHCLEDLLYRQRIGELPMDVTGIVSNHPGMRPIAERHGIPYYLMPVTPDSKAAQESRLLELIDSTQTDLVVLARYMQIFSDDICKHLRGRAVNIHHSFLPGFKGAKPYHQAHTRGVKLIGATAHFVTADLDEGPIIEQIVERVDHSFTPEMLAAAGRDSERRALSTAVRLLLEHRVFLDENKTVVFK